MEETATPVTTPAEVAQDAAPGGLGRIFRPLAGRDFRLLFIGETISLLGDQFHFIALAWLTLEITGSGLALGTVLLVAGLPRALLVLVGGVAADRFSPRTIMLGSNSIRALIVGVLTLMIVTGTVELWMLYILAFLFGAVDAFFWPAQGAIVPMLVDEDQLPGANGLMQGSQQLTGLIGPALAGILVAAVGTAWAFGIDAISFAVASLALALIVGGRRRTVIGEHQPGVLRTIRSGLSYAWQDPAIRSLILLSTALNFAISGPISVGIAWMANNQFEGGAQAFGFILAAFGAGALLGAIVAGSLGAVRQLGWLSIIGSIVMGIALALVAIAPTALGVMILALFIGLAAGFLNVRIVAWLQKRTPGDMMGRVMSLVMLGGIALSPLSMALTGALVDLGYVALCFIGGGFLIVLAAFLGVAWGVPTHMREG
ncbi:MAG TPA: MFS transporter [Candidatus Limnocylindria bacterium]|nr:MFS transporter [Candidatus Limnocylindria bacterium]